MTPSCPIVLAVVSDVHAGSTVALCPDEITLDDGGEYHASKAQRWLWQCWKQYWEHVDRTCDDLKAELYVVFNGDLTEGDHHHTTQILSGNPTAQAAVVDACMRVPLALNPNRIWVIRGTEAHVGPSACYEERIAKGLLKDGRPVVESEETGTASHWHARIELHGTRIDLAHHGSIGSRAWTRNNVTNNLAADLFYNHSAGEIPYPHLAFRAHMHQFADTGSAHPVRVLQSGAFQLKTAFTHRIDTRGKVAEIGGWVTVLRPGLAPDVQKIHYKPEVTPLWRP